MRALEAVDSVEFVTLVDNVTDSLSPVPAFVETEFAGITRRRQGAGWKLDELIIRYLDMRLAACALALGALVACTQPAVVATTPAHAGEESPCDRLSRLERTTKPRLFAAVELPDRDDSAVWREFEAREAMVEAESYTDAEVWTSDDGWLVSITMGSPSGDWMNSVDYCFRSDQSLATIHSSLGTVYADPNPVTRLRVTSFSPDGRQLSQVTTVTDQATGQVIESSSFQDKQEEIFKTVRDLPFARFLQLMKQTP